VSGSIRPATKADVPAILDLAEAKREEYQRYQPTFWRKAGDSRAKHGAYLETLVESERVIGRVHETEGVVDGFVFASLLAAPPVYDPGGPVCLVDDFATRDAADWSRFGAALLADAVAEAKRRGAVLAVVIAGHLDEPKRAMLAEAGYSIASEWHVRGL
jgi:GNAT superfamily N-acetyltransferase